MREFFKITQSVPSQLHHDFRPWQERVYALAKRLDVGLPPDTPVDFWPIILLEAIVDRMEVEDA